MFASNRLAFLNKTAAFRRIGPSLVLTLEPSRAKAFECRPQDNAINTSRMLVDLEKTATILEFHLGIYVIDYIIP
jgi:type IV secretion system protein VirB4